MTIRILNGLAFKAHSPCCYELLSVRDDIESGGKVTIEYDGQHNGAGRAYWFIHYRSPQSNISRAFVSREAAVAMIANRRSI